MNLRGMTIRLNDYPVSDIQTTVGLPSYSCRRGNEMTISRIPSSVPTFEPPLGMWCGREAIDGSTAGTCGQLQSRSVHPLTFLDALIALPPDHAPTPP